MTAPKKVAEQAYSITSAADLKELSSDTIRKAIRTGALRAVKVGRGYRISASALEAWWDGLEEA